ncbi:hypothetical protein EV2_039063 [Malus domestica]
MVTFDSIPSAYWNSLGLSLLIVNNKGDLMPNIWVLHSTSCCSPTVISSSGQQVTFQASFDGVLTQFTIVYAATTLTLGRVLYVAIS